MTAKKRVAILISGRGSNMRSLVEAARAPGYPAEIVIVVSNRPDAPGLAWAQDECSLDGEPLSGEVRYYSTGGTYGEALEEAYFKPFEEKCGVDVIPVSSKRTFEQLVQMHEAGHYQYDMGSSLGYEFPLGKNMRLTDAIALAGGTSNQLADKVFVIRRREGSEPMLVSVSLRKAKRDGSENMLLEPGDTVSIEQTPGTVFLDAIRTVGVNLGGALF